MKRQKETKKRIYVKNKTSEKKAQALNHLAMLPKILEAGNILYKAGVVGVPGSEFVKVYLQLNQN